MSGVEPTRQRRDRNSTSTSMSSCKAKRTRPQPEPLSLADVPLAGKLKTDRDDKDEDEDDDDDHKMDVDKDDDDDDNPNAPPAETTLHATSILLPNGNHIIVQAILTFGTKPTAGAGAGERITRTVTRTITVDRTAIPQKSPVLFPTVPQQTSPSLSLTFLPPTTTLLPPSPTPTIEKDAEDVPLPTPSPDDNGDDNSYPAAKKEQVPVDGTNPGTTLAPIPPPSRPSTMSNAGSANSSAERVGLGTSSPPPAKLRNGVIAAAVVLFVFAVIAAFIFAYRRNNKRNRKSNAPFRDEEGRLVAGAAAMGRSQGRSREPGDSFIAYMDAGMNGGMSGTITRKMTLSGSRPSPGPTMTPSSATTPSSGGAEMGMASSAPPPLAAGARPDTLGGVVDRYNSLYGTMNVPKGTQRGSDNGTITRELLGGHDDSTKPSENWRLSGLSFVNTATAPSAAAAAALLSKQPPPSPQPSSASDSLPRFSPSGLTPQTSTPRFSASLPQTPIPSSPSSQTSLPEYAYTILHGWVPQRSDELLLESNDQVAVYQVFEDGWCEGMSERSGLVGMFPLACLKDPRGSQQIMDAQKAAEKNNQRRATSFFDHFSEQSLDFNSPPKRFSSIYTDIVKGRQTRDSLDFT
ncbi:hypothetical protein DFJ77DRAFT_543503 [Powellomyces hirtus]|nr:hypothetical protein DFJ77DRAFT_543503 [Powellomyces hirtus]